MKIAIGIETVDRRRRTLNNPEGGVNYLAATMRNLRRSGVWTSPLLHSVHIVDGGSLPGYWDDVDLGCAIVHPCPPEGRTRQQNGREAIRFAAETGADLVIKLEDDLDFCADFLGSVARWHAKAREMKTQRPVGMYALAHAFATFPDARYATPGESVLGPGSSFRHARLFIRQGRTAIEDGPSFWGAQAVMWERRRALEICTWLGDDPVYTSERFQSRSNAHDLILGSWLRAHGLSFVAACPSFVQHIGRQSSIAKGTDRFFEYPWPGPTWRYV